MRGEANKNAMGGTELMALGLIEHVDRDLLKDFQIVFSRIQYPLDESKVRIYYCHDLPGDPASDHLKNEGWKKFHRLVFASNWQMQAFINYYSIPWSKCIVLQNAIKPVEVHAKPKGVIKLAYWSTPHRGLNILVPVFDKLSEKYNNIELDVFSSFKLYGWEERDKQFEQLFETCRAHPKINYHGSVSNETLRHELKNIHILAYPSIWLETSCITLMEAMSAGILCVHPNYGALPETSGGWTHMYQWNEDMSAHAQGFYQMLDLAVENYNDPLVQQRMKSAQSYANIFYNWEYRALQWKAFLTSLQNEPRAFESGGQRFFEYRTL